MPAKAEDVLYRLPDRLRESLREPFGEVLSGDEYKARLSKKKPQVLVTVGDVVTATASSEGVTPHLSIVDYKTLRGPVSGEIRDRLDSMKVERKALPNLAATVSRALWNGVAGAYRAPGPTMLVVEGEEDLATLPAIALAPPGTTVIYGMPSRGPVWVEVTAPVKERVLKILSQMPP